MIKVQGKSEKNDLKDAEHFWLEPYKLWSSMSPSMLHYIGEGGLDPAEEGESGDQYER